MTFQLSKRMLACVVFASSFSLISSATVMDYHYGIEVEGATDTAFIDHNIGLYEIKLRDTLALLNDNPFESDFSVYAARDFINLNWQQDLRGNTYLDSGDVITSFAASFESNAHADDFVSAVENKETLDVITDGVLSGSQIVSRLIDVDIEAESEQVRTFDTDFANELASKTNYSNYSLELSFDFLSDLSTDMTQLDLALYESLYSLYEDFDSLASLIAVEHDMFTDFSMTNSGYYSGQFSRTLWFNDHASMIAAEQFFTADISEAGKSGYFSGEALNRALNDSHPMINRDIQFSNVSFQAQSHQRVSVNEPSTLFVMSTAFLVFAMRRVTGKKR